MPKSQLHRNKQTDEMISKSYQWCSGCGQNFSSTKAGDKHRVGNFFPDERRCLTGEEAGLKAEINDERGTKVYRLK